MSEPVIIAVDVGGTQIRVCAVKADKIIYRQAVPTQSGSTSPGELMQRVLVLIEAVRRQVGFRIAGIGLVMPGPTNGNTGVVYAAPNLPGWDHPYNVREWFRVQYPDIPVFVDNDANAACLGEYLYGSGVGTRDFVYLTISTGIGGGAVIDGKLQRGASGTAAELGHMSISLTGPECNCGNKGCLEAFASGTAIARDAHANGRHMDAKGVAQAAALGYRWAYYLLRDAGQALGVGLANIANIYNPEVIALGGGVMKSEIFILPTAINVLRQRALPMARETPVMLAKLGDDLGLFGAAALVRQGLIP